MKKILCVSLLVSVCGISGILFADGLNYKMQAYKATSTHKVLYKENGDVVYEETTKYYLNADGVALAEAAFSNQKAGANAYDKNVTVVDANNNLAEISAAK